MRTDNKRFDYLVTFFVENRMFTKLLSELIKNKTNQYYIQTLGLPVKFSIPFFQEEINGQVSRIYDSVFASIKQVSDELFNTDKKTEETEVMKMNELEQMINRRKDEYK